MHLSFVRDIPQISFGAILFVVFAYLVISGTSNAVNLTDGLDGLAAGASAMVFGAYTAISFYQFRNACETFARAGCYEARDPLDIALIAAAAMAACFGFLWWNASPARIFMGDTGSLALGGAGRRHRDRVPDRAAAGRARRPVRGRDAVGDPAGRGRSRRAGKRLFRMAPIHHHFELAGWARSRSSSGSGSSPASPSPSALGLFYAEFISYGAWSWRP